VKPNSDYTGTEFVFDLSSGDSWAFYFESSVSLSVDSNNMIVATPYTGYVQIAFLGSDKSTNEVYRKYKGSYVKSGEVDYSFHEHSVDYFFKYNTSDADNLLMFAMPHH
jgi:endoglucanase Acf2